MSWILNNLILFNGQSSGTLAYEIGLFQSLSDAFYQYQTNDARYEVIYTLTQLLRVCPLNIIKKMILTQNHNNTSHNILRTLIDCLKIDDPEGEIINIA